MGQLAACTRLPIPRSREGALCSLPNALTSGTEHAPPSSLILTTVANSQHLFLAYGREHLVVCTQLLIPRSRGSVLGAQRLQRVKIPGRQRCSCTWCTAQRWRLSSVSTSLVLYIAT